MADQRSVAQAKGKSSPGPTEAGSESPARLLRHVLIVDDDSPIRTMLADTLGDAGYGVTQAADGYEALQRLREARPDLIVLDLMLPGMSGWQFLERSHAHLEQANIPVVIVSAISGRGDYPAALGVAAWLTKPVDIDQFLGAVEAMVGPSRAIQGRAAVAERPDARRVLVIEDEQSIRDLIVEHLAGEGFLSSGVATVADAQAAIAEQRPSLVVLDLMLPGTSGFALLEQRRDNPMLQEIPVLVLSAAPPDKLLQAKKSGADAFLSKPFDFDALTALVRSYVH